MAIISGVTISDGGVTIAGGGAPATDPYFMYNSLLLPGNGTNTAQNNTFLDGSTNNFTITRNGNTTQGTFGPYGSNWSNYLESGNFLTLSSSISQGSTWTIEFWYNINASGNNIVSFESGSSDFWLGIYPTAINYAYGGNVRSFAFTSAANTWYHVALINNAGSLTCYINGAQVGTTQTGPSTSTINKIGGYTGIYNFAGYISNFRVTTTAVYTSAFTPSTTPLTAITGTQLLTCQSNRFIDNSASPYTITPSGTTIQRFSPFSPTQVYSTSVIGGSGYIATAATSYLAFTDSSNNLDLGGAVASFETWIYPTAVTCIIAVKSGGTADYNTTSGVEWSMPLAGQQFIFYYNNGGSYSALTDPTTGRPLNQWYHYAVASNATTISLFVNGIRVATATTNVVKPTNRTSMRVGEDLGGNGGICYLSDTRFIRGAGAYDPTVSTITIPSAPLTAVANTQLLLNYTNAGIIDNAMMNNLETVGNAQISTTQSKFGGSSMAFDGTGDSLFQPSNLNYGYGTGDFTIEFWLYLNATTLQSIVNNLTAASGASVAPHIYYANASGIRYYVNSADRITGSALSTGVWYHIAVSRSGSSTKMFINGTQTGSTYTDTNNYGSSNPLGVGDYAVPQTGTFTLNGYIDDLRITKGYARYTTTFTPPTTAFPLN